MSAPKGMRGATSVSTQRHRPRRYLLLAGGLGLLIVLGAIVLPTQETDANTPQTPLTDPVAALEPDATPGEPATTEPSIAIAPEVNAAPPEPPPIPWHEQTVKSGDNLSLVFKRAGYTDRDVYDITRSAKEGKSLTRIFPGQTIAFQADAQDKLVSLRHVISKLESVEYHKTDEGFTSERIVRTPEARPARSSAEITSSLFLAGQDAGLSQNLIMEVANIFGGVIDFVLDPRRGDSFHVVYEELYLDGEKLGNGDILAASFVNQGKVFNAFHYEDSNGDAGYYNEQGVSMRKAFLLAPVDFRRISSNFNLRRLHPIYKTTRPHRGTDYAASRGTPVFAAGDGRVVKAGYTKANGNYVVIQHGEAYQTKYLHLHKRKVKKGQRVSQSQIIGTVGSTGAATGPHLHYEFLANGVHRNPRTIHKKLPKAKSLDGSEMPRFKASLGQMPLQLAALQSGSTLALNDDPETAP